MNKLKSIFLLKTLHQGFTADVWNQNN